MKYYRFENDHIGLKFFKVKDEASDVVQITVKHKVKKGRAYCPGITKIKYTSWVGSYAWYLASKINPSCIKEITQKEWEKQFSKMLKNLEK